MKKLNLICLLAAMLLPAAVNAQVPWVQTFYDAYPGDDCSDYGLMLVDWSGYGLYCTVQPQNGCDSSLAMRFSGTASPNYIALPIFPSLSTLTLSFTTRPDSTWNSGSLTVGYLLNLWDTSTFVAVNTYYETDPDFSGGACALKTVSFTGAPDGATIAFRHNPQYNSSTWWVDNIQVSTATTCGTPTAVSVNTITMNSAELEITPDGMAAYSIILLNEEVIDTIENNSSTINYTLTGLNSASDYQVAVYSLCDSVASGFAALASFSTLCGFDLPFFEDFTMHDMGETPKCYMSLHNSTAPYVFYQSDYSSGLSYSVLAIDSIDDDVLLPLIAVPDSIATYSDLQISFNYWCQGPGTHQVGLITNRSDINTFVPIFTIDSTNAPAEGTFGTYDIYLTSGTYSDTVNIVFRSRGCSFPRYLTNIRVVPAPNCRRPIAAWIDTVTSEGVYLSWSPYNDGMGHPYEVAYNNSPNPDNGATIVSSTFPDTTLFVGGLPKMTRYGFWVRTICGSDDTSEWYPIGTASLPCPTGYNAPYYDDFSHLDESVVPVCWTRLQVGMGNYPHGNGSVEPYLAFKCYNQDSNVNLIAMPYVRLQANNIMTTVTAWIEASGPLLELGYLTDIADHNSFVPLDTVTALEPTEYDMLTSSVSPTIDTIWIAFRASHGGSDMGYINNVLVREIPDCVRPAAMNLDDWGHNYADFTLSGISATQYEVRYSTVNNLDSSATISMNITTNVFSITSLTPSTTYYTWVRSICGYDTSDWRIGPSFTTKCGEDACPVIIELENPSSSMAMFTGCGVDVYSDTTFLYFVGRPNCNILSHTETLWICPDMAPIILNANAGDFSTFGWVFPMTYNVVLADSTVYTYDASLYPHGSTFLTLNTPCPTCTPVQSIAVDTVTIDSISISWIPADTTNNSWIVYLDNVAIDTVSTTSFTFSGLNSNTGYSLGVATNCNGTPATIVNYDTVTVCALYEPCPIRIVLNDWLGAGFMVHNAVQVWSNNYLATSVSSLAFTPTIISEDVYVCSGDSVHIIWNGAGHPAIDTAFEVSVFDGFGTQLTYNNAMVYSYSPEIISFMPNCPCLAPDTIETSATTNSITIRWTSSDSTEVSISESVDYSNDTTVFTNTGTVTFSDLTHNTIYYIRLRSYCRATGGISEWGEVQDTTLYDSTIVPPHHDLPCPAPDSLELLGTTYTTATIGWIPGGDESQWEIELNRQGDITYLVATETQMVFDSLWPEIVYTVRVRAICGEGYEEGVWSDPLTFSTDVCPPVTSLTISDTAVHGATVAWTQVLGSVGYKLLWGLPNFFDAEASTITLPSNANQYAIDSLQPETAYEVYILNKCTETLFSAPTQRIGFTTLPEVGILTVDGNTLTLSPNPASDKVNISINAKSKAFDVEVIDMNGITVLSERAVGGNQTIDVSRLSQGTYIVRITSDDWTAVRKLIVK